jgi:hypothetical protein
VALSCDCEVGRRRPAGLPRRPGGARTAGCRLSQILRVRADTTVVEADVGYPTDTGLLAQAVGTICRTVARIKAAGAATGTPARDRRRSAGRRARAIASKLRLRGQQQRDEAQAAVRRITGELADIAEAAIREAGAVLRNAKRGLRTTSGLRKGRLQQAINHLDTMVGRGRKVVAQARSRLAGVMPESATRLVSLHDADARPIRKGRLGKPVEFGYKAQIIDNADGVILDHNVEDETRQTHRNWRRRSNGSPAAPEVRHGLSPPIAATETFLSNATYTPLACAMWRFRAEANHLLPAANSNTGEPSAPRSNGEPDPKAASTISNEATAGTARNSPASMAPGPGAATASSPTTWSRSAPSPHETAARAKPDRHTHPKPEHR